jgi:hypothetical protein
MYNLLYVYNIPFRGCQTMSVLSKQILLKVSPELDDLIDRAFSKHLKKTGEYITRSDYIRRILQEQCLIKVVEDLE